MNNNASHEGVLTKRIFKNFVLVTIFVVVFNSLINVVDGIFILKFYNTSTCLGMSGRSITNTLLSFALIVPNILMVGNQKRYANQIALGHKETASKIFSWTIVIAAIYSVIILFINFFFSNQLADFLSKGNESIKSISSEMIKASAIGLPFMFINQIMTPPIVIDGGKKSITASLITTTIFNLVGNLLVVFVFKSGPFGIMLSTSIAHIATTLVLCSHFFSKKNLIHFSFHLNEIGLTKLMFIKGSSGGISKASTAFMALYLNFMLLRIGGPEAISVWGMQHQVLMTLEDFIGGIMKCAYLIQYIYFAEEDFEGADNLLKILYKIIAAFTVLCIIVLSFTPLFVKQYAPWTENEKILLIVALISCGMLLPFDSLMQVSIVFSSLARCNIIYFLSLFVFPYIFSVALFNFGAIAFIIGYAIGRSFYPILHLIIVLIKYKEFPRDAKRMFFMPENSGYGKDEYIDVKINDINDCMTISKKVLDFCKYRNIENKKANVLATCAEEMANIYVMSVFAKDKTKYYCSIKICNRNNKTIFRFRDDCPYFVLDNKNPKYIVAYNILINSAKNITYTNFFGVNNFIITL